MAEAPAEAPKKKIFRLKKSSTAAPAEKSEAPPPAQSVIITTVGDWAKQRQKSNRYTFTPQGDLVGPDQTIIEMNPKILASPEV